MVLMYVSLSSFFQDITVIVHVNMIFHKSKIDRYHCIPWFQNLRILWSLLYINSTEMAAYRSELVCRITEHWSSKQKHVGTVWECLRDVFPQTLNCNHDQCDWAHLFVVHVMAEFMHIWKEVGSTQVYHGHTHESRISFPRLP